MLIDTCIVIDFLRDNSRSIAFLQSLPDAPALSVISVTEVVAGLRSNQERQSFEVLLTGLLLLDVEYAIASGAGDYVRRFQRSHGVDPIDAVIAATAAHHNLPLATLNLKHFPMFEGLTRPY